MAAGLVPDSHFQQKVSFSSGVLSDGWPEFGGGGGERGGWEEEECGIES